MIKLICPLCVQELPNHTPGCHMTSMDMQVGPHEFVPFKGDARGRLCNIIWCPYTVDEHPVVESIWLNPKDKVVKHDQALT